MLTIDLPSHKSIRLFFIVLDRFLPTFNVSQRVSYLEFRSKASVSSAEALQILDQMSSDDYSSESGSEDSITDEFSDPDVSDALEETETSKDEEGKDEENKNRPGPSATAKIAEKIGKRSDSAKSDDGVKSKKYCRISYRGAGRGTQHKSKQEREDTKEEGRQGRLWV